MTLRINEEAEELENQKIKVVSLSEINLFQKFWKECDYSPAELFSLKVDRHQYVRITLNVKSHEILFSSYNYHKIFVAQKFSRNR